MNNLSNKELCLLYLLTTDAIVRCKQSAGVDYPLSNVDVFQGIARKLLDSIIDNRTNYEQNRMKNRNTLADYVKNGYIPKCNEINSYNKDMISKTSDEVGYHIDIWFVDDSSLAFDVIIPVSDLFLKTDLTLGAILKNYRNWTSKIVELWNADGLYQTR